MNTSKIIRSGGDVDFSVPAELIGHPTRAAMLLALLDRKSLSMSMLAYEAGISTSTASGHLSKLVAGGLLVVHKQGKYRHYELASLEVALAIEALGRIAPVYPIRSLRAATRLNALRTARCCYDHLAGRLGVAVLRSLLNKDFVYAEENPIKHHSEQTKKFPPHKPDLNFSLTGLGMSFFKQMGVDISVPICSSRRKLISYCWDWTEQSPHLSGQVGAVLLNFFLEEKWLMKSAGKSRALSVTPTGQLNFAEFFAINTQESEYIGK